MRADEVEGYQTPLADIVSTALLKIHLGVMHTTTVDCIMQRRCTSYALQDNVQASQQLFLSAFFTTIECYLCAILHLLHLQRNMDASILGLSRLFPTDGAYAFAYALKISRAVLRSWTQCSQLAAAPSKVDLLSLPSAQQVHVTFHLTKEGKGLLRDFINTKVSQYSISDTQRLVPHHTALASAQETHPVNDSTISLEHLQEVDGGAAGRLAYDTDMLLYKEAPFPRV